MQQNNNISQNTFTKGLNLDLNTSLVKEDLVTYARNATVFSQEGDFLFYQTEQANKKIVDIPYPYLAHTKLPDGTYCLFLTDNTHSEIGVFDPISKSYTTKLNQPWLNFNNQNIISAVSKENADCSYSVYWADGRRNPDRVLNLSKVSQATYDNIRLTKLISLPTLSLQKSVLGLLKNGAYQVGLFYCIGQQRIGNFHSLSTPIFIHSQNNNTGALEINISDIDDDFLEYQLVLIQTSENTTTAKVLGVYPRTVSNVHVSNFDDPDYQTIPLQDLVVENEIFISSDQIDSNNEYLFRSGVETIPEVNYQKQAFTIEAEYVVYQARKNYYKEENNVGYYRDEVYLPYIQLLHKTSKWSSAFPLKGPDSKPSDLGFASGKDVYEFNIASCNPTEPLKEWQVTNTAGKMNPVKHTITDTCSGWEIGYGEFGYFESTDTYPDNPIQFGNYAGKPIQLFKFPDEEKVPRYSNINGNVYINILGFRLKNIPQPLKEDGTVDEDWIGYRIIRADREGNRRVISRGLFTNTRGYTENDKEVLYSNYPLNDLNPDVFISKKQTYFKNNIESAFDPLTTVYQDKFNFYSPHNKIGRYGLASELKFETEEYGNSEGEFIETYNNPKQRIMSQFGYWICMAGGMVEAAMIASGAVGGSVESEIDVSLTGGSRWRSDARVGKALDFFTNGVPTSIRAALAGDFTKVGTIAIALATILLFGPGIILNLFVIEALTYANELLDILYNFLDYKQYTYQHNSYITLNNQKIVGKGNKRRFVSNFKYLEKGLQTFNNILVNNFNKENSVILSINEQVSRPTVQDNTRIKYSNSLKTNTTGSAYYGSIIRNIENPYGRVETTSNFIKCHDNHFTFSDTPILFGGDCFIVPDFIEKKHLFFTQDLSNTNFPDGTGYDYRLYRNIGFPRYWFDSFKYDFSSLLGLKTISRSSFIKTTDSKFNLDGYSIKSNDFRVNDGRIYTSANAVVEYICESDFNTYFRDKKENEFFASDDYRSVNEIFRSDRILTDVPYRYDLSFSKKANQVFAKTQNVDYNPAVYNTCYKYDKNLVKYSLPTNREQRFDNWLYFLTLNEIRFPKSEFGNLTGLHRVDGERILFLFDRSSPFISVGRQQLELSDLTITIGDGGLFAQKPKELLYTETSYGNSQSRYGAISSQFGTFYLSERQGKFFRFNSPLEEISKQGIYSWAKFFFPLKLPTYFPSYTNTDNYISGVGMLLSFDANAEMFYISKRDFIPKQEFIQDITCVDNVFYYKDIVIQLTDSLYFEDVSFNISYYPSQGSFISFHDWIPEGSINGERGLFTFKNKAIWLHNQDCENYCNFYGTQYPFEVEFVKSNKLQVQTLSSFEYILECYKYNSDCINRYHLLNENFDRLFIYNSEQCSGELKIVPKPLNHFDRMKYPIYNQNNVEILFSKVENKYRIDQFCDLTKDRNDNNHIMHTFQNGWKRIPNPTGIDYKKSSRERKLFRHYDTRILFGKSEPTSKMIIKMNLTKGIISQR